MIDSHRFFTDPVPVLDRVLTFLDLPACPDIRVEQHNARPRAAIYDAIGHRLEDHFIPYDEPSAEWLGWVPSWRA